MRWFILSIFVVIAQCQASAEPNAEWQSAGASDWATAASYELAAFAGQKRPTALMVVQGDRVIAQWGAVGERVNIYSVRKSLLNALFGIAIGDGRIDPSRSIAALGLDDKSPALTPDEQQATIRDLLMARSGIYHVAAYETSDMETKRPPRGSHPHGTYWFYNNWDFNALGAIYRQQTREDIFEGFARRIARPIGMEDFSTSACRYVFASSSTFPAYTFRLSARDLARFGLLYLNAGRWNGAQILPADWVAASTRAYSATDHPGRAYGYLWWTLPDGDLGRGTFMAAGNFGQFIIVAPAKRLVFVETVNRVENPHGIHSRDFVAVANKIAAMAP